jgi:hypothetical protein
VWTPSVLKQCSRSAPDLLGTGCDAAQLRAEGVHTIRVLLNPPFRYALNSSDSQPTFELRLQRFKA